VLQVGQQQKVLQGGQLDEGQVGQLQGGEQGV